MKTISLNGPGSIEIIEQDVDNTFEQMVLLKVISSGVCAADSYLWTGNHPWKISYPIVPGHEIFGQVVDTKSPKDYPVGSKVVVQVNVPCYSCELCLNDKFNMCVERRHFGSTYKGSFAEYISIPVGARIHCFKEAIDDQVGGLSETMANAIYCASRANLNGSERILILGMGSIGACLAHYLRITYPSMKIAALTSSSAKRDKLIELEMIPMSLEDSSKFQDSFDVVFETSGYSESFKAGLNSLKPTGLAVIYGVFQKEMMFDFNQVSEFKELTLIGGHLADDNSFDLSVKFLSDQQNELGYLISNIVGFNNFSSAFSDLKFKQYKTLFQPRILSEVINGI